MVVQAWNPRYHGEWGKCNGGLGCSEFKASLRNSERLFLKSKTLKVGWIYSSVVVVVGGLI